MKHNVNIECIDNGWLIRWTRNETEREMLDRYKSSMGFSSAARSGSEIFTSHKKLLERVKELTQ